MLYLEVPVRDYRDKYFLYPLFTVRYLPRSTHRSMFCNEAIVKVKCFFHLHVWACPTALQNTKRLSFSHAHTGPSQTVYTSCFLFSPCLKPGSETTCKTNTDPSQHFSKGPHSCWGTAGPVLKACSTDVVSDTRTHAHRHTHNRTHTHTHSRAHTHTHSWGQFTLCQRRCTDLGKPTLC